MNDKSHADDHAPDETPNRFDLPADSTADELFLRRQRRRRLGEFTGQSDEPDRIEDFFDDDQDGVESPDENVSRDRTSIPSPGNDTPDVGMLDDEFGRHGADPLAIPQDASLLEPSAAPDDDADSSIINTAGSENGIGDTSDSGDESEFDDESENPTALGEGSPDWFDDSERESSAFNAAWSRSNDDEDDKSLLSAEQSPAIDELPGALTADHENDSSELADSAVADELSFKTDFSPEVEEQFSDAAADSLGIDEHVLSRVVREASDLAARRIVAEVVDYAVEQARSAALESAAQTTVVLEQELAALRAELIRAGAQWRTLVRGR